MIGPEKKAMAVRRPNGEIELEEMALSAFSGAANWPFVRGSIRIFRQLVSGTKALLKSAELSEEFAPSEDEQASGQSASEAATAGFWKRIGKSIDRFLENHSELAMYGSTVLALLMSVVLFFLLPNLIVSLFTQLLHINSAESGRGVVIVMNLAEGLIRIIILLIYLKLANRMKEMKRVWMYHGAEHKTIACYEDRKPMTVDNVRQYSRFHPRCGTAFLFIVILISIIVFSFVGWWSRWINLLIRFALVPVVAGIAYEIIRLAGRYDNKFTRLISKPGLLMQRLTTAEPDDSMLEVAIVALNAVIPLRGDRDQW